jgi:hypothetical protein
MSSTRSSGALLFAAMSAIGAAVLLLPVPDMLGMLGLIAGGAVVLFVAARSPAVALPLLAAFTLRALLALVHEYLWRLPVGGDAATFARHAAEYAAAGPAAVAGAFEFGSQLWTWLIAMVFLQTGESALLIAALNVCLGSLIVWNVHALALLIWGAQPARIAAWIVALHPFAAMFSAVTLREVVVVYPLTLAALYLARWGQQQRPAALGGAVALLALSGAFHQAGLVVLAFMLVAVPLAWGTVLVRGRARSLVRLSLGALVMVVLAAGVLRSGWGIDRIVRQGAYTVSALEVRQDNRATDRAAYLAGMTPRSPLDLVWQTPVRVVYFLFAPFPWMVRNATDAVALADAAFYLLLAVYMARRLRSRPLQTPASRTALVATLLFLATLALNTSNYGTALRHRAKVMPLLVAFAAGGMVRVASQRPAAAPGRMPVAAS